MLQSSGQGGNLGSSSDPYSGSTEYGSGTTGGAGYGDKSTSSSGGSGGGQFLMFHLINCCLLISFDEDSTSGKLMEKVGGMFHHKGLEEKGAEKRSQASYGDKSTSGGYSGNDQSNY